MHANMPSALHVPRRPKLQDSLDHARHRISPSHREPFRAGAARPRHCCISSWDTASHSQTDLFFPPRVALVVGDPFPNSSSSEAIQPNNSSTPSVYGYCLLIIDGRLGVQMEFLQNTLLNRIPPGSAPLS